MALSLATVAFVAGFVDTLAGGGGLITIPAFLLVGLTPAQALATNKCQALAGTLTAASRLMTSGHIKIVWLWPFVVLAFVMAPMGAWSLRAVSDVDWLDRIVPVLLFAVCCGFIFWFCPTTTDGNGSPAIVWRSRNHGCSFHEIL